MKVPIININFSDTSFYFDLLVKYFFSECEMFSLITEMERPYSRIPPHCEHDRILEEISSYLVDQLLGIRRWNNNGTNKHNKVMNIYKCCKATEDFILNNSNLVLDSNGYFPEDFCIYKKKSACFSIVSHEPLAFIYNPTHKDKQFLKENGIRFFGDGVVDDYTIHNL